MIYYNFVTIFKFHKRIFIFYFLGGTNSYIAGCQTIKIFNFVTIITFFYLKKKKKLGPKVGHGRM